MQSVNRAKFLNITPLFLSSNRFGASSAPAASIVLVASYKYICITIMT